jgi:hypothetical protein
MQEDATEKLDSVAQNRLKNKFGTPQAHKSKKASHLSLLFVYAAC